MNVSAVSLKIARVHEMMTFEEIKLRLKENFELISAEYKVETIEEAVFS